MPPTRRQALQIGGATILSALAGCTTNPFKSKESPSEYNLTAESIDASPVEYALYKPDEGALFGTPARNALDDILPNGRHTSYGYKPLPSDAYVTHDELYYETKHVVTGRTRMERQLVRVDPIPKEEVPDDAVLIDTLDQPSSRPLKILHSYTRSNGETSIAELLTGTPTCYVGQPNRRAGSQPAILLAASSRWPKAERGRIVCG